MDRLKAQFEGFTIRTPGIVHITRFLCVSKYRLDKHVIVFRTTSDLLLLFIEDLLGLLSQSLVIVQVLQ